MYLPLYFLEMAKKLEAWNLTTWNHSEHCGCKLSLGAPCCSSLKQTSLNTSGTNRLKTFFVYVRHKLTLTREVPHAWNLLWLLLLVPSMHSKNQFDAGIYRTEVTWVPFRTGLYVALFLMSTQLTAHVTSLDWIQARAAELSSSTCWAWGIFRQNTYTRHWETLNQIHKWAKNGN